MAFSPESLAIRLANQLVSTMEEHDALRTKLRLVSAQASTAQADKATLARRLFSSASNSVRHESELRSLLDDNKRLVDKLRAAAISATALKIAVSPKGRLATLFDKLFEQLEDAAAVGKSREDLVSENTLTPVERESRAFREGTEPQSIYGMMEPSHSTAFIAEC